MDGEGMCVECLLLPPFPAEAVRVSCRRFGVAWKAYGCTGDADVPLYDVLFVPLYIFLGVCTIRGACWNCCGADWKASADDGRACNIVMVLEDCIGRGSTSAIGSAVV